MKLLFDEEVNNNSELEKKLQEEEMNIPTYKVGVLIMLTDIQNRILLQRRGPKCRDEQFKLETIGGGVEETDYTFRDSIMRELQEEVGTEAEFEIKNFVGTFLETKIDKRDNENINWLFIVYEGKYLGGKLEVVEPEKCLGYEFYNRNQLPISEMSMGCQFLLEYKKTAFI